jgi:hypothetical protein
MRPRHENKSLVFFLDSIYRCRWGKASIPAVLVFAALAELPRLRESTLKKHAFGNILWISSPWEIL